MGVRLGDRRNGSSTPTRSALAEVLPSPAPVALTGPGGGEGGVHCSLCGAPASCVWEDDGELVRICGDHCPYCSLIPEGSR